MYGSIFWSVTRNPRASSRHPIEAAASPLPSDETTPPVTKMYFVATVASFVLPRAVLGLAAPLHPRDRLRAGAHPARDLGRPQPSQEPPEARPRREPERLQVAAVQERRQV